MKMHTKTDFVGAARETLGIFAAQKLTSALQVCVCVRVLIFLCFLFPQIQLKLKNSQDKNPTNKIFELIYSNLLKENATQPHKRCRFNL